MATTISFVVILEKQLFFYLDTFAEHQSGQDNPIMPDVYIQDHVQNFSVRP